MSISRCKCDKTFDTDHELNTDEKGNCCCDNCYEEAMNTLDLHLKQAMVASIENGFEGVLNHINFDNMVEYLMESGYRLVKI